MNGHGAVGAVSGGAGFVLVLVEDLAKIRLHLFFDGAALTHVLIYILLYDYFRRSP